MKYVMFQFIASPLLQFMKQRNYRCVYLIGSVLFITLLSCSKKSESNNKDSSPKFEQYYIQGEQLYIKNCSNCHQKTGTGLGLLYPPLKQSDYLLNNLEQVICLMR